MTRLSATRWRKLDTGLKDLAVFAAAASIGCLDCARTSVVALENLRSRMNSAYGMTGQGFKDRCAAPAGENGAGR